MGKIFKKKNIKYYLIFYLIVECLTKFSTIKTLWTVSTEAFKLIINPVSPEVMLKGILILLFLLFMSVILFVFMTAPVTIFLLAKKSVDITHEVQNQKYNSKEDIIYFREKLQGISPATISIMQNLNVEENKDIAATLMKLQLNKNISIENDTINVLSEDVSNLTSSEKQLLYMIADNKINKMQIAAWKVAAIGEAKSQGYIKEQDPKTGLGMKKLFLFTILIIFILVFASLYPQIDIVITEMEQLEIEVLDEMEFHEVIQHEIFDEYMKVIIFAFSLIFCFFGIFTWPIFYISYTKMYKLKKNSLKRTEKGDQLTDVILAMKRFIHDFSMLDTATKEQIALWDDFLIYAIVLEENENIVDEILNFKDIKKIDAQNLIK